MYMLNIKILSIAGILTVAIGGTTLAHLPHATAQLDGSDWLEPNQLILHKQNIALASPSSLYGNVDCALQADSTCTVSTGYGYVDQTGSVKFKNTKSYHKIYSYIDERPHLIAVPGSDMAITYTTTPPYGVYLYFNAGLQPFVAKITPPGSPNFDYQLNQPPDGKLADLAGNLLAGDPASISFSSNGKWMVVSSPNTAMLRVDLNTFEVLPFATGFNYSIGVDPAPHTAISNDGRYAVVSSKDFGRFEIYDLSTCGSVPMAVNGPVSCQYRDVQKNFTDKIDGFIGASNISFISNSSINLYAGYNLGGKNELARYVLSANSAADHQIEYLALGDSFISGEGARNYKQGTDTGDNKCHLSLESYPLQIGHYLDFNSFNSVACSGAKIEDILDETNGYKGQTAAKITRQDLEKINKVDSIIANFQPGYIDQLDFVSTYQPKTITVSIGGNNIGFSDIIKKCAEPWNVGTCYASFEDRLELVNQINNTFPDLVNTYQKLKNTSASDTNIYVIGYPQVAKVGGDCALNVHLNASELVFAQQIISYLDQVIERAATRAGVSYVDTQNALNGHRLCEASGDEAAINGLTAGNDTPFGGPIGNESYHPNKLGYQLLENAILDATQNLAAPMPLPDSSAAPPSELGLAILQAPVTGRVVNTTSYDDELVNDTVIRGTTNNIYAQGLDFSLSPNSSYDITLHSEPINIGTFKTDANGNLKVAIQIPTNVPTGMHTLHIYGVNIAGEPVDIYKTLYVAASLDDLDGDGTPNSDEPCLILASSGQDYDQDGIDDSCDGTISSAPTLANTVSLNNLLGATVPPLVSYISLSSSKKTPNNVNDSGEIKTGTIIPKVLSDSSTVPKISSINPKPKVTKIYPDQRQILKSTIVSVGLALPSVFAAVAWRSRD